MPDGRLPLDRLLELVGSPGAYETLVALHGRGDVTFAQIDVEVYPHAERSLRALAAAGIVTTPRRGSWDAEPQPDTSFALTSAGTALLSGLGALQAWADEFPALPLRQS